MRSDIDFPGPLYPSLSDQIASEPVLFLAGAVGVAVFSWGLRMYWPGCCQGCTPVSGGG